MNFWNTVIVCAILQVLVCSASSHSDETSDTNSTSHSRAKRFSFFDKLRHRKLVQKHGDDGLSKAIENSWHDLMRHMHHDFIRIEGESVDLKCNNKVSRAILKDYPKATSRYTQNGEPIVLEASRMLLYKGTFSIRELQNDDTGVYACMLQYWEDDVKIIGIFSVIVKTEDDLYSNEIRETEDLELSCNSDVLTDLYPKSNIQWLFNGSTSLPQNISATASANETLVVPRIDKTSNGIWSCQVKESKRLWHTAWYRVKVNDPPPLYVNLYRMIMADKKTYGVLFSGCVGVLLVLFLLCAYCAHRIGEKNEDMSVYMESKIGSMKPADLMGVRFSPLVGKDSETDDSSSYDDSE